MEKMPEALFSCCSRVADIAFSAMGTVLESVPGPASPICHCTRPANRPAGRHDPVGVHLFPAPSRSAVQPPALGRPKNGGTSRFDRLISMFIGYSGVHLNLTRVLGQPPICRPPLSTVACAEVYYCQVQLYGWSLVASLSLVPLIALSSKSREMVPGSRSRTPVMKS